MEEKRNGRNGKGRGNGGAPEGPSNGGEGGLIVAESLAGPRKTQTIAMILRAIETCPVHEDPERWSAIIAAMERVANDLDDPRAATRAVQVLAALRAQNLAALQYLDKAERLDAGSPTEIVDAPMIVTFDQRG